MKLTKLFSAATLVTMAFPVFATTVENTDLPEEQTVELNSDVTIKVWPTKFFMYRFDKILAKTKVAVAEQLAGYNCANSSDWQWKYSDDQNFLNEDRTWARQRWGGRYTGGTLTAKISCEDSHEFAGEIMRYPSFVTGKPFVKVKRQTQNKIEFNSKLALDLPPMKQSIVRYDLMLERIKNKIRAELSEECGNFSWNFEDHRNRLNDHLSERQEKVARYFGGRLEAEFTCLEPKNIEGTLLRYSKQSTTKIKWFDVD